MHDPPDTRASRRRHTITTPAARTLNHKPGTRRARLGQNFLIDRYVARRIVGAAQISESDRVLEIGPGKGALTGLLSHRASSVLAVEVDEELASNLSFKLRDTDNVSVLCEDALTLDPESHFDGCYKVVANLPYYVATPLIRKYLTARPAPTAIVVMVQKEVAETIAAQPGKMGLLSVIVQMHGSAKVLFSVPPKAFKPRPKVTSAVIRIDPCSESLVPVEDPDAFIEFVAAGFRAPRKQIRNSLSLGLGTPSRQLDSLLEDAHVDPLQRPATLDMKQWYGLYESWLYVRQSLPRL